MTEQVKGVGFLILLLLACYGAWGLVANSSPASSNSGNEIEMGSLDSGDGMPSLQEPGGSLSMGSPPTVQMPIPTLVGMEDPLAESPEQSGTSFGAPTLGHNSGEWRSPFSPPMSVPDHVSSLPHEAETPIPYVTPPRVGPSPGAIASTTVQPISEQEQPSVIGIPATVHEESTIPNPVQGEMTVPPLGNPSLETPSIPAEEFDPMNIMPESIPEARLNVPELPPIQPMEIVETPTLGGGSVSQSPIAAPFMPDPVQLPVPTQMNGAPVAEAPSIPQDGITPLPSVSPTAQMPNAGRVEAIHFGPTGEAPSRVGVPSLPEGAIAVSIPGIGDNSRSMEIPPMTQGAPLPTPPFVQAPVDAQISPLPPVVESDLPALPFDMIAEAPLESLLRAGVEELDPRLSASTGMVRPECSRFLEEVRARLDNPQTYVQQLVPMYEVLSAWYGSSHLTKAERILVTELLDQVTGTIVYSQESWLEEPYIVRAGDRLDLIARQYGVPWQLLAKVNQIREPGDLPEGMPLKVLRGPFSAVVDLSEHELILRLDGKYAGRFEIGVGRTVADQTGTYKVRGKARGVPFQHPELGLLAPDHPENPVAGFRIDLGEGFCLHGTPKPEEDLLRDDCPGYVCLRPEDMDHVIDILSDKSMIVVQK
jgi:hypothetical protein